jgi:hypothetical protein
LIGLTIDSEDRLFGDLNKSGQKEWLQYHEKGVDTTPYRRKMHARPAKFGELRAAALRLISLTAGEADGERILS